MTAGERAAMLGTALFEAGLTPGALRACAGAHRPLLNRLPARDHRHAPACALARLFCCRQRLSRDELPPQVRSIVDELVAIGLAQVDGEVVSARHSITPLAPRRFAVAPWDRLPDDSSLHLVGGLPDRRAATWLDVGTGSAFAPLLRPEAAESILGVELDAEAATCARLGIALSGVGHVEVAVGDLFPPGAVRRFALITFNAPIPEPGDRVLERFADAAPAWLEPTGEIVVHSRLTGDALAADLRGNIDVVEYTPAGEAVRFGITRWQPHRAAAHRYRRIALDADHPHLERAQLSPRGD